MYKSPLTQQNLKKALAGGVRLWYCPESHGRLITLNSAKKALGEVLAKEIWVRAQLNKQDKTWKECPACRTQMRYVQTPKWGGDCEVDVCVSCHLIWLDQGEFPVVPHPEDFINKDGDSTQVSDFVEAKAQTLIREDKKRIDEENIQGRGPDSMIKTIFGFFSLPVEMDDNKRIDFPLFTWGISLLCFLIHVYFTNNQTIQMFGFYPKLSLNGDWLNYIVNVFMHGDYFHLLSNLYFFLTFADNVEDYYGKIKFVLIILLAPFIINFLTSMISIKGNLPHIGLSGVITAIMVLYGFTFRNSRIAFLIPYFHFSGSLTRSMHYLPSFTWLRFKAKYVVFFYCIKDLLYYFLFEKEGATNISHSSHLAGAIIGMLIYFLLKRLESSSFELTTH